MHRDQQTKDNSPLMADVGSSLPARDIGWAIKQMWHGQAVARRGWNGAGQFLRLQVPDTNSKMSLPYVFISTVRGDLVPWLASQTDLLATDWQLSEA